MHVRIFKSYLHHGIFFYELIVSGCERQIPVYAQYANKRNHMEHVHGMYSRKTNKKRK